MTKLGKAGDRFGDYSCVDCANFLSGHNQFINTNITRPITIISKPNEDGEDKLKYSVHASLPTFLRTKSMDSRTLGYIFKKGVFLHLCPRQNGFPQP